MTQSAIATNLHQPLDIHRNGFAQIAFNHPVSLDNVTDAHGFFLSQVFDLGVNVDSGFLTDFRRAAFADAEYVRKPDLNPFVER